MMDGCLPLIRTNDRAWRQALPPRFDQCTQTAAGRCVQEVLPVLGGLALLRCGLDQWVTVTMATWADWQAALAQAKLAITPAELHGSVTGYLCAGWGGTAHELLAALALESDGADAVLQALVDAAARDIHAKLRDRVPVGLLLPDGSLAIRADAMVDWCRGFLGGLGLTGVLEKRGQHPDLESLLADFGRIAATHLECGEDDEDSFDEVLDFIHTGVLRLHAAFAPAARP